MASSGEVGILNVRVKGNFMDFYKTTEKIKENLYAIQGVSMNNLFKNTGIEGFNKELSNAKNNIKQLGASSIFKGMSRLGSSLTRKVTMPLAGLGVYLGKQESTIEHELNNISAIIEGDYKNKKEDIKKWSREISNETGSSWREILQASYQGIQSSVDFKDLESITRMSALLAKVGGDETTTANAMDLITTYMNAYGLSAKEAEKLSGQFFKTQLRGKVTIGEMADSMGRVALLANKLKVDIPESLGIVSALTAQGLDIRHVSTGLNAVFNSIIKPSQEALDTVEQLNHYLDSIGEKRIDFSVKGFKDLGMKNWLQQVIKATGGNEELLGKLFPNIRATGIVAALSSKNTWSNYDKFTKEISASDFNTVTQAAERMKGPFQELKEAWNEFKNTLIEKGVVEKTIGNVTQLLERLTHIIEGLDDNKIDFLTKFAVTAAVLGPILKLIGGVGTGFLNAGKNAQLLSGIIKGLGGSAGTIAEIGGAASAAGGATASLGGAGLAMGGKIAIGVGIAIAAIGGFAFYLNYLDNKVQDVTTSFEYMAATGNNAIQTLWNKTKTQVGGLIDGLKAGVQDLGNTLNDKFIDKMEDSPLLQKVMEGDGPIGMDLRDPRHKEIKDITERYRKIAEEDKKATQELKDLGKYKRERPTDYLMGEHLKKQSEQSQDKFIELGKNGLATDKALQKAKEDINKKVSKSPIKVDKAELIDIDYSKNQALEDYLKMQDEEQENSQDVLKAMQEQQKAEADKLQREQDIVDKKQEEERIVKSIGEAYKQHTDELKRQMGIGDKIKKDRISIGRLLRNERKKAEMLQNLQQMQGELAGKIGNKEVLSDIYGLGLEGYGKVEAINRMSQSQLNEFINSRMVSSEAMKNIANNNTQIDIEVNVQNDKQALTVGETLKREFDRRGISIA